MSKQSVSSSNKFVLLLKKILPLSMKVVSSLKESALEEVVTAVCRLQ